MQFTINKWSTANLKMDIIILLVTFIPFIFFLFLSKKLNFSKWHTVFHLLSILTFIGIGSIISYTLIKNKYRSIFLTMHITWTMFSVVVPLILLIMGIKFKKAFYYISAAILILFKFYAEVIGTNHLDITRITLKLKGIKAEVRIVHFTDLQTDGIGYRELQALKAANEFKPNLVFFTGDVLNHKSLFNEIVEYLKKFKHTHGAYFVRGNWDYSIDCRKLCSKSRFTFLDQRVKAVNINGNNIALIGTGFYHNFNTRTHYKLHNLVKHIPTKLVLSHAPDALFSVKNLDVNIIFSGHTHGGQFQLPFFGALRVFSRVKRKIASGGLHKISKNKYIIVNRGLGLEGHIAPRIRVLCRPQIILLTLIPE